MRIVALEAANIKAIRAVAIVPNSNVVQITGANGAGKSSVLDAIFYALAGKKALPSKPVRSGEDTAFVHLDLGEVRVTRRFTADGKTDVIVEAESGARFPSPQKMLDDLLGELAFDPLRFASADARAQLETLRGLVKLEVDVDELDRQNQRDYEYRRDVNRDARTLEQRVATLTEGLEPDMDVTPIDVTELTDQMASASAHNSAILNRRAEIVSTRVRIDEMHSRRESILSDIARLEEEYRRIGDETFDAATRRDSLIEEDDSSTLINVRELQEHIVEAGKTNSQREHQRRQRHVHAEAQRELLNASAKSAALTRAMEERVEAKTAAIARASMPVPGLSFGDGEVIYNGEPFAQASQAERIRVSFAIAVAMNPKLRVALIRDGSLLDSKSLALIGELADEKDFQVFVERVDESGKIGVLIEEGEVAAIDGVRIERADRLEPASA